MAIYSLSMSTLSRSKKQNITKRVAYIFGERYKDFLTGKKYSYKNKEGVLMRGIVGGNINMEGIVDWNEKIQRFLDETNKAEKKKNAVTARQFIIAIPPELNIKQQTILIKDFCLKIYKDYGCDSLYALHAPDVAGGSSPLNYHAHILISTRDFNGKKIRCFDKKQGGVQTLKKIRKDWEILINEALKKAGIDIKLSSESLKAQGIDRTPQKHLGVAATNLERRVNRILSENNDKKRASDKRKLQEEGFLQEQVFKSNKRKRFEEQERQEEIKRNAKLKQEIDIIESNLKAVQTQKEVLNKIKNTQQNLNVIKQNLTIIRNKRSIFVLELVKKLQKLFNKRLEKVNKFKNQIYKKIKESKIKEKMYPTIKTIYFNKYKQVATKDFLIQGMKINNKKTEILIKRKPATPQPF